MSGAPISCWTSCTISLIELLLCTVAEMLVMFIDALSVSRNEHLAAWVATGLFFMATVSIQRLYCKALLTVGSCSSRLSFCRCFLRSVLSNLCLIMSSFTSTSPFFVSLSLLSISRIRNSSWYSMFFSYNVSHLLFNSFRLAISSDVYNSDLFSTSFFPVP